MMLMTDDLWVNVRRLGSTNWQLHAQTIQLNGTFHPIRNLKSIFQHPNARWFNQGSSTHILFGPKFHIIFDYLLAVSFPCFSAFVFTPIVWSYGVITHARSHFYDLPVGDFLPSSKCSKCCELQSSATKIEHGWWLNIFMYLRLWNAKNDQVTYQLT